MFPEEDELQESGLYEHYKFVADKGVKLIRVDKFLVNRIENCSRSRIQNAIDADSIYANGKIVKANYKVKPADVITIVMSVPVREIELIPQNIPIKIVYEDDDLLVINKDAGMVVHPGHGNYTGTLVNAVAWHLKDTPLFQKGEMRPGLVHRIDKNTSGLLLMGKNEIAMNKLAKQFFDHKAKRKYIALVWGNVLNDSGTITGNIARSLSDRKKFIVYSDPEIGKHAITHYNVLERFQYVSLVECILETGRTHQIRVHFQNMGHPLFGDPEYGGDKILKGTTHARYKQFIENCFQLLPRQALHAKTLGFVHPATSQEMEFDSELPEDMKKVIDKWRQYTGSRNIEAV